MRQEEKLSSSTYKHAQKSVQRPDVGVEAQFPNKKTPKTYRYDSSLAPELCWDENGERPFAEWLLNLVAEAAEKGEDVVFAKPQVWQGTEEEIQSLSQCAARLRSLTKPFLNWTGKAERQQISVPTLPLFVHERHSTQAILETLKAHKALGTNLDLFGDPQLDVADKLDAYEHKGPWTNRLVLGDSLQVMNSLLEYEGMGGQVQMIYFDPPYGVKFGSNFQPFVRKRDVTHGKDEEMIREPEMVKAYRDTWELGLHSYLSYMRDRLLLARELLRESGSIFVQISEENLHHVREVMDEVFGEECFVSQIVFQKSSGRVSDGVDSVYDLLLWYAKDREKVKFQKLFKERSQDQLDTAYNYLQSPDGSLRSLTVAESANPSLIPDGLIRFRPSQVYSQTGGVSSRFSYEYKSKTFSPPKTGGWRTSKVGLDRLAAAHRLMERGQYLAYRMLATDFSFIQLHNVWADALSTSFGTEKLYVVQTSTKVIQRCILMTSDPGDLVMDITCGSGTTAVVAEQWGRRWITCDTSRVPLALARQRLLTATFPWYRLKNPAQGPAGGLVYERKQNRKGEEIGGLVGRTTLKSIANNEEPEMVTLVDRPEVNKQITRVCGTFTVEATIQAALTLDDEDGNQEAGVAKVISSPRAYLDRMIEVLRQSKTLRLPGNVSLELETVRPLADRESLHAEATAKNGSEKRIAIVFGPEDGAIGSEYVFNAHTEALQQGFQLLFLFGFAIQAKAREMLDKLKIPTTYVAMTPDVVMSDLLKTSRSSEIFSITGLPDVRLKDAGRKPDGTALHQVEVLGLDIFRPDTMETDSIEAENLPCWMLDTNYNGMVFCASQVFFPKTGAWDNLQKSLKGEFNDSVWEHLAGTVSEPFALGDKRRIAVKVIDDRGNELMVVKSAEGAK
jgi:adenine-specific DNA-methyltransferase